MDFRCRSRCICPHLPYENVSRLSLAVGDNHSNTRLPIMSARKGKSILSSKSSREILWTVEAELEDGQQLYVTGDPAVLGRWNPEMAIPMSPASQSNLWNAEIKIDAGVSFKYNYFIKEEESRPSDIMWRAGPEFSLLVPLHGERERKIMVRDSWINFGSKRRYPGHVWGSWIEEKVLSNDASEGPPARGDNSFLIVFSIADHSIVSEHSNASSGLTDEDEAAKCLENDSVQVESSLKHLAVNNGSCTGSGETNLLTRKAYESDAAIAERDQPVEEPWLLGTLFLPVPNVEFDEPKSSDYIKGEVSHLEAENQLLEVAEKLSEEGKGLVPVKDPISTVILINSSICTMQRIAVLEDEKLVELLLQPVKSNVQCDSVYLGIVTKLVPNMGGAFVNIGSSRHSLMDIKKQGTFHVPSIFSRKGKTRNKWFLLRSA